MLWYEFMKIFKSETERHIVQCYLELLSGSRPAKISVQAICAQCFISRRTFYHYFENIEALADKAIQSLFLDEEELPVDIPRLITLLKAREKTIRQLTKSSLYVRTHDQLAAFVSDVYHLPKENPNSSLIASGLAHVILEWLCGDINYSTEEIIRLCIRILSILEK